MGLALDLIHPPHVAIDMSTHRLLFGRQLLGELLGPSLGLRQVLTQGLAVGVQVLLATLHGERKRR